MAHTDHAGWSSAASILIEEGSLRSRYTMVRE
jgi:hypothetical protein